MCPFILRRACVFGTRAAFKGWIDGFSRLHPSVEIDFFVQNLERFSQAQHIAFDLFSMRLEHFATHRQRCRPLHTKLRVAQSILYPHSGGFEPVQEIDPTQHGGIVDATSTTVPQRCWYQADPFVVA